jgi:hypothetical protein
MRSGTVVVKFHLRISKEEQKRRLLARLDEPAKRWKFSADDVAEHKLWDRHMEAYMDCHWRRSQQVYLNSCSVVGPQLKLARPLNDLCGLRGSV